MTVFVSLLITRHEAYEERRKGRDELACQDVQPTLFVGLKEDVHFYQIGHLKQLVVQGNVYVLVYDSAVKLGGERGKRIEGKLEEYSKRETLWGKRGRQNGCCMFKLKWRERERLRL